MQRLGESARRVRPEGRGERRPEHGEPLAEEVRAERLREEAGPRRCHRHEEDLQENEQRLRRPRAETRLPRASHEGERHLEQREAHAVGRHRVTRRPRDGERLPAGDPELEGLGDRDRRVEHLLLVGNGPERALFGRRRKQEKGGEDRKAERPRDGSSEARGPSGRHLTFRSGEGAPDRGVRLGFHGEILGPVPGESLVRDVPEGGEKGVEVAGAVEEDDRP